MYKLLLLGILAALLCCATPEIPLRAVFPAQQIKLSFHVLSIPEGYELNQDAGSVTLTKGNSQIKICESSPGKVISSCEIKMLPTRNISLSTNFKRKKSSLPLFIEEDKYNINDFTIYLTKHLRADGLSYKYHYRILPANDENGPAIFLLGKPPDRQATYELKWIIEHISPKSKH